MANVMLSSESSKNPSKPFKLRIQELRSHYDDILIDIDRLLHDKEDVLTSGDISETPAIKTSLLKKLDYFNGACDEVYQEVQRRRQRLLNKEEGELTTTEVQHQLQSVGFMGQVLGDFRVYLNTGEKGFIGLTEVRAIPMKSPPVPTATTPNNT